MKKNHDKKIIEKKIIINTIIGHLEKENNNVKIKKMDIRGKVINVKCILKIPKILFKVKINKNRIDEINYVI